jgi:hypothetical protein
LTSLGLIPDRWRSVRSIFAGPVVEILLTGIASFRSRLEGGIGLVSLE